MTSSLKTIVLRSSNGIAASTGDIVSVRYQGNLVSTNGASGEEFDANYNFSNFSTPAGKSLFEFQLGQGTVISGWEKGLLNRKLGEVLEITIPPSLAYGASQTANIPANSTLRFKVEIVGIFSPDSYAPFETPKYNHATLANLGIQASKIGLTTTDILSCNSRVVGLNSADILTGNDTESEQSPQTSKRDLILGLAGNDLISGGASGDFLIGGPGKNIYTYKDPNESSSTDAAARDKIFGFTSLDKIDISAFEGNAFYSKTSSFSGKPYEVIFKKPTSTLSGGLLQWDGNGDKIADFEIQLWKTMTFSGAQLIG